MKYQQKKRAALLPVDGTAFYGKSVGYESTVFGEACFNTDMTSCQKIFIDPSYFGQIMVAANAYVGNYDITKDGYKSNGLKTAGLVCRNFSYDYSHPKAQQGLQSSLDDHHLVAICEVNTRALVSYICDSGSMNAVISTETGDLGVLKARLNEIPSMKGLGLTSKVSTAKPYFLGNPEAKYRVVALDFGVKHNTLRHLANRDIYVRIFPYNTPLAELKAWNPDGYFPSNGPGDPGPLTEVIAQVKQTITKDLPIFGICLRHQIIALASGIPTYKMHNGHRDINHPVKNLLTGKDKITSQNRGFAVSKAETETNPNIEIIHTHLNNDTVMGLRIKDKKCFSMQYHPEAAPGPNDATYLFGQFVRILSH